jgi:hypothetical protein
MDTLIHADIFFFVTTVAVVVVAVAFTAALVYLIKVLRQVEDIGKEIKAEAVLVREDIHGLRTGVKREGFRLQALMNFFQNIFKKRVRATKSKTKK